MYGKIDKQSIDLISHCDYIVMCIKNDVYCSGFLYSAIKYLMQRRINKRIILIISGTPYIEKAVTIYQNRIEELLKLVDSPVNFIFGGLFSLDLKRLTHSMRHNKPICKLFPESPICGALQYNLRIMESQQPFLHDQDYFSAIQDALAKN
jgi:hypothetical protein